MKRNNNYTLERFSPYGIRAHADNVLSDLYASTFVRDMTNHFSILLSQSFDHHGFYTIEAEDDKLKELLSIDDYWFLEYDFDKILSSIMYNLIFANKTFVEIAFSRNEANEIVGISLFPFDAIKIASVKNHSWFVSRKPDKKISVFKLERNKYIEFNVKELGLRKNCLKRIVKKLKKINITASTKFVMDEKIICVQKITFIKIYIAIPAHFFFFAVFLKIVPLTCTILYISFILLTLCCLLSSNTESA